MNKFEVVMGLPVTAKGSRAPCYPYRELKVGESFWAATPHLNTTLWARTTGYRFTTRKEQHNGTVGRRVWRVE